MQSCNVHHLTVAPSHVVYESTCLIPTIFAKRRPASASCWTSVANYRSRTDAYTEFRDGSEFKIYLLGKQPLELNTPALLLHLHRSPRHDFEF